MIFIVAWLLVPDGLDSHTDLLELSDITISGVYREWYEKKIHHPLRTCSLSKNVCSCKRSGQAGNRKAQVTTTHYD